MENKQKNYKIISSVGTHRYKTKSRTDPIRLELVFQCFSQAKKSWNV